MTSETAFPTVYDIPLPTKDEAALLTMDEATVRTMYDIAFPTKDEGLPGTKLRAIPQPIPQPIRGIIPRVGASIC